jgi:hypothetical protein
VVTTRSDHCLPGAWRKESGGKGTAGRKRGQHSSTAVVRCHKTINSTAHTDHTSYSQQQLYYNCSCQPGKKHVVYLGVRTANHRDSALDCRVCARKGSKWEGMLYELCDAEELIELYAVEAHSLDKAAAPVECEGVRVCPESKRWDVAVARPEGLLIEMQGEGHSSRLVAKANNTDSSLAERQLKDSLYAEEAMRQGWSVLWLWVDGRITCPRQQAQQWAAQLKRAMVHVTQRGTPELFDA